MKQETTELNTMGLERTFICPDCGKEIQKYDDESYHNHFCNKRILWQRHEQEAENGKSKPRSDEVAD